jgi:hypothetical protein
LTPEAFFRVCDPTYKKVISVDTFKQFMKESKLELSKGQMARIILILDEDMGNQISLVEYQNALEAYGQSGEPHFNPDGSDNYVPFETRALFKMLDILEKRKVSFDDFYNSIDLDKSNTI